MRFWAPKRTYLDYASATPVLPEALEVMKKVAGLVGNPGAIHAEGVLAAQSLESSREKVAHELGCKAREIVFVSGGTEANNLSILGFARNLQIIGKDLSQTHWVVSAIEHPSVLECFSEIERLGGVVSHVDPDERGIISAESVARALRPNTVFVSVQWANHEIGTIQSLRAIAREIAEHEKREGTQIIFHSDFGQAPLYISPQVHTLAVDLASIDSGKLYGPRGIGCVYLSNRVALAPVIVGGGQERGLRAGTENIALAAGFAESFAIISEEREQEAKRVRELRDELSKGILAEITGSVVNGSLAHSLPHLLNISVPNISSEYVTLSLDRAGISISTKSACKEGEARSHVVEALGDTRSASSSVALAKEERASNTLRFSLGRDTSAADIEKVIRTLKEKVALNRM